MNKTCECCDRLLYWVMVLVPFSLALGPAFTNILLGMALVLFILKRLKGRQKLYVHTALNIPFLLLILAGFLSFRNTLNLSDSMQGISKLLKYGLIFLITSVEIRDKKHLERIALAFVSGAVLVSIDAFWQICTGRDFIRGNVLQSAIGLVRPTASFPNPNVLGIYLSAVTPFIAGLGLFYYKARSRAFLLLAAALATAGVYLTLSRGSGLGLYFALLFMAIARRNKTLIAALVVILLIFPFIMPKNIKNWSREVKYNPIVFMLNYDRLSMYRNAVNMIRHHPVVGVGINTFSDNYHKYKLAEPEEGKTPDSIYAHNSYLHTAGEIGLLGLSMFLVILVVLFVYAGHMYKKIRDDYYQVALMSLLACILAYLVNALTETSLYYPRVVMIFWYLVGCVLAFKKFLPQESAVK